MLNFPAVFPEVPFLLYGVPLTIALSMAAFTIGTVAALPLATIRIARTPLLSQFASGWIEFFRTTPPLVHIVWIYYVFPVVFDLRFSDLTVVIIALAGSASAQMAEILRAGIQSVAKGQLEAARVLGLSDWQRLWYVTFPLTVRIVLAPACNTIVSLIKDFSLAAIIAVPELMNRAKFFRQERFGHWRS